MDDDDELMSEAEEALIRILEEVSDGNIEFLRMLMADGSTKVGLAVGPEVLAILCLPPFIDERQKGALQ